MSVNNPHSEHAHRARRSDCPIRPARDADAPRIRAIIARIYAEYGDVLDIEREDPHLREPCAYFRAGGGELWVAEGTPEADDGPRGPEASGGATPHATRHTTLRAAASLTVAGSGGVVFRDAEAEIKTVYVAREFRRRGIARRLVATAIEHARAARGARAKIMLWSDTRFIEAHALYESLGFVRGHTRDVVIVNSFSEYRYDLPS